MGFLGVGFNNIVQQRVVGEINEVKVAVLLQENADVQVPLVGNWADRVASVVGLIDCLMVAGWQVVVMVSVVEVIDFRFNSGCGWGIFVVVVVVVVAMVTKVTTTAATEIVSSSAHVFAIVSICASIVIDVISKSPRRADIDTFLLRRSACLNFDDILFHAGDNCIAEHSS